MLPTTNPGIHLVNLYISTVDPPTNVDGRQPFGDFHFVRPCDQNLKQAILLAQSMIELADRGDGDREDTGCGILYGVLRDSGYKIKRLAEDEKLKHMAKGWWDETC